MKSVLIDLLKKILQYELNVIWAGEDIDVGDNIGEESLLIFESVVPADRFIVEANGMFFKVDIELHIFEKVLAHFIDEQHHKLTLVDL